MQIKNMFEKQIDRDIKGVIKVGQSDEENIYQELDEYVVTKELLKHFRDFFENYDNYCKNKDYYIVKPTYTISNSNIYIKDKVQSGDIIYISDELSLDNYKILLISLNYHDLKVISLSKLISEKL